MPTIRETITTALPLEDAFAFVADFANAAIWDPGTASSERQNPGPVGIGARYRLGVRMRNRIVPMEYAIVGFEPARRVILEGDGSGVSARDDISFAASSDGTRIEYVADIHLKGLLRLAEPFLSGAFAKLGRDARDGMKRTLDERARTTASRATPASTAPSPGSPAGVA